MSIELIGGADGPTSIFLAGKVGNHWFSVFGFIIVILMLIPNIIFAIKNPNITNHCNHKSANILEQIGRYAAMFFMVFHIGLTKIGCSSVEEYGIYGIGNVILLLAYWIIWILYFRKKALWKSMALAIIPSGIFLLSGILLRHYLLMISAVIFGIFHIYVTYQNAKYEKNER